MRSRRINLHSAASDEFDSPSLALAVPVLASAYRDAADHVDRWADGVVDDCRQGSCASADHYAACGGLAASADRSLAFATWMVADYVVPAAVRLSAVVVDPKPAAAGQDCVVNLLAVALPAGSII